MVHVHSRATILQGCMLIRHKYSTAPHSPEPRQYFHVLTQSTYESGMEIAAGIALSLIPTLLAGTLLGQADFASSRNFEAAVDQCSFTFAQVLDCQLRIERMS
jgi:hypothetical protein